MAEGSLQRREVLKFGTMLTVAGALGVTNVGAQEKEELWDLKVEIPRLPCFSAAVRSLDIGPLVVSPDARLYGPGQAHWGSVRFTSACTQGASKELQAWFDDVARRPQVVTRIDSWASIVERKSRKPVRTYTFVDCFPTGYSAVNLAVAGNSGSVMHWTLEVRVDRIEMA